MTIEAAVGIIKRRLYRKKGRSGGIGRRKGLKIPRWQQRTGSIPVGGTESKRNARTLVFAFLFAFYVCQVVCQKCLKWQTKGSKYPSF